MTQSVEFSETAFFQHYVKNAPHLMWFLGAGTSRSAGLPTATDIIWDLKQKFYCLHENQDLQSHDINNKAIKSKIQERQRGQVFILDSFWPSVKNEDLTPRFSYQTRTFTLIPKASRLLVQVMPDVRSPEEIKNANHFFNI